MVSEKGWRAYGERAMYVLPVLLFLLSTADAVSDVLASFTIGAIPRTLVALPLLLPHPFVYLGVRGVLSYACASGFLYVWGCQDRYRDQRVTVWLLGALVVLAAAAVGVDAWMWFQVVREVG